MYSTKLKILEEIIIFLNRYQIPKLNLNQKRNLNRLIAFSKTETVSYIYMVELSDNQATIYRHREVRNIGSK